MLNQMLLLVRHKLVTLVLFLLCLLFQSGKVCAEQNGTELEYKVKAGFILNFAKFVKWPKNGFANGLICLGVYGDNPFGPSLFAMENKIVQGKQVKTLSVNTVEQAKRCHLIFISKSNQRSYYKLIDSLRDLPILTVSDIKGFSVNGGVIEFVSMEGRLGFIVNKTAADNKDLEISANLLRLAQEVR